MGYLKPISKIDKRSGGLSITADKYERLCLSKELRNELQLEKDTPLYLYFDEEDRRIGISKNGSEALHAPYKFDGRGYTSASDFLEKCGIDTRDQAIRFIYEGTEKGIMTFHQVGIRKRNSFNQEKNGNLERLGNQ